MCREQADRVLPNAEAAHPNQIHREGRNEGVREGAERRAFSFRKFLRPFRADRRLGRPQQ